MKERMSREFQNLEKEREQYQPEHFSSFSLTITTLISPTTTSMQLIYL